MEVQLGADIVWIWGVTYIYHVNSFGFETLTENSRKAALSYAVEHLDSCVLQLNGGRVIG